jgi:hypothetical protein
MAARAGFELEFGGWVVVVNGTIRDRRTEQPPGGGTDDPDPGANESA